MKFLVQATHGPMSALPEEGAQLLKELVLPSFDKFLGWESAGILTGGLPVGDRAFVVIMDADSNESLDEMLRGLPMWGSLDWTVTPLTSFSARAAIDRQALKDLS